MTTTFVLTLLLKISKIKNQYLVKAKLQQRQQVTRHLLIGASCTLASEEWAKTNGHEVLAYAILSETVAGFDFVGRKKASLMALLMQFHVCLSVLVLLFKISTTMKSMKHLHHKYFLL